MYYMKEEPEIKEKYNFQEKLDSVEILERPNFLNNGICLVCVEGKKFRINANRYKFYGTVKDWKHEACCCVYPDHFK